EFDPEGNYIQTVGSEGSGNGQFKGPEGIAIDSEGFIWVSDTYNGRIQKLDKEGNFVEVVSSYGPEEGQVGEPTGIDIGVEGDVFVADWKYSRVVVFNSAGEFVRQWGSQGGSPGQFYHPPAITVDAGGNVWVGDEGYDRISQFDESGEFISWFGSFGSGPGQFDVWYPFGIAVGEDGRIWVTDSNNNRIQQWGYPPVCQEGGGATDWEQPLESGLDCEGTGPLEYEVTAAPEHGKISELDPETGLFTYTPDPGYTGLDSFAFRANNTFGPSSAVSFELRVGNIPIAAYSFDEENDDVAEDLFGEHDGTVEGATWTEEGRYGPGLVLDGTSQVTVPDTGGDLDLTGEFTLEAWVRPHFESGAVPLFAKEDSTSPYFGYLLYGQLFDSSPYAYLSGSGFKKELWGTEGATPSNTWTHVALTSNKSQAKLYVNGKLDSTGSAVTVRSTDGPLRIGGFEHFEEYLDGRLDEVRIYDTVLTEAEIEQDKDTPLEATPPPPDGPVA
ncbi:MAG TPA: LamG-like jellyroll fold domain-containing protein, partial [Nitrospiraceae bacterium]|nr:LamG-like jellyroll fold domain-containing protein [Nitrospiraceae bacterium]